MEWGSEYPCPRITTAFSITTDDRNHGPGPGHNLEHLRGQDLGMEPQDWSQALRKLTQKLQHEGAQGLCGGERIVFWSSSATWWFVSMLTRAQKETWCWTLDPAQNGAFLPGRYGIHLPRN